MNIIAIDPSLTCTAMVVNDHKFVYASESTAMTKKMELKRWFKEVEDLVAIRTFPDISKSSYSESECNKLTKYVSIANRMSEDIGSIINPDEDTFVAIEGYSYSSAAGPLIDLVTLGTLIRVNTFYNFGVMIENRVFQPTEVKSLAAKFTYPPIAKNKVGTKFEYRNGDGIAGGSFKKPDIYKALIENSILVNDPWVDYLKECAEEALSLKSVPKPIEDINDAKILYEIVKNNIHMQ